jgi:lipid-A-disaccharide synthase
MKIFLSAAEVSSDVHAAVLLRQLRAEASQAGVALSTFGVGGAELTRLGHENVVPASEFLVMGLIEVLGRYFKIRRSLFKLVDEIESRQPDALILLDYPSFHFALIKALLKRRSGDLRVPVFYYIPPKVWGSRPRRTEFMAKVLAQVYCIFPFELPFLLQRGVPTSFFGNPLADELPVATQRSEARERLGLKTAEIEGERTVLLMPGSRPSELRHHFPIVLEAAALARAKMGEAHSVWTLLIPLSETVAPDVWFAQYRDELQQMRAQGFDVRLLQGQSHLAMIAADAGLIKSGTSTLEAAVLGCPHSVLYQLHPITVFFYRKILGYKGPASLVNLFEGGPQEDRRIVREFLAKECRSELLADSLVELLRGGPAREEMKGHFARLRDLVMGSGDSSETKQGPSRMIARDILARALKKKVPE